MKKVLLVICALVMSGLFSHEVLAKQNVSDTDAQIVQTFCQDLDLFSYVNIPKEKENKALIVSATLDKTYSYRQAGPISKVSNSSEPVSYLFLVDISTSMPGFKDNINTFINDFMCGAGDNASFAIASFGKTFKLECDFTKNQEDIKTKSKALKYDVRQTSLYSSIISAVDYFGKKTRSQGEMYNIIVISDGIEADKNDVTGSEAEKKIKESSVLIHIFGLPTKSRDKEDKKASEDALKVLGSFARASFGVHTVLAYDNKTETDLANEITGFVKNLYRTEFNISNFVGNGGSYSIELTFATTGEKGDFFSARGTVAITDSNASTTPAITGAGQKDVPDNNRASAASSADGGKILAKSNVAKLFGIDLWLFCLIVVALLVGLFLTVIMIMKKQKKTIRPITGIYMKAEALSGTYKLKKKEFYLLDELYIGRDKSCEICINNKDVSKKNSRVYVRDNVVYIEDLNSTNGTSISNMKVFSPNKLRSGDVISIGSISFCLKF